MPDDLDDIAKVMDAAVENAALSGRQNRSTGVRGVLVGPVVLPGPVLNDASEAA